jgi:UDP-glucose 4-epimerase
MKVLVTGANGFLGHFVTKELIANDHSVFATDVHAASEANKRIGFDIPNYYSIDLTSNFEKLIPLITEVDAVIHLAALVGNQNQIAPASRMFETNVILPGKVILACSKLRKYLVFSSTSEIFGKNPKSPWNEFSESEFGLTSESRWAYGIGKALIEELIFGMSESNELSAATIRLFNLYGPGQGASYLIPRWIDSAIRKVPIEIYGSGKQEFSFTYVEDAAKFISRIVGMRGTGPFNFGTDERTSLLRLSEVLRTFFPDLMVNYQLPNRDGETSEFSRIFNSLRSDNPYQSFQLTSLEEGLRKTIDFRANFGQFSVGGNSH